MKLLIVEDEIRIAKLLEKMIGEVWGDQAESVHLCHQIGAARNFLSQHPVDILFLDLNLKGEDGFQLLREFVAESFFTVIVSAHRDKAIEAFEYGVLDFIPKPFNKIRLQKTLERIQGTQSGGTKPKYLAVKKLGKLVFVPIAEIQYFKAAGHYAEIHSPHSPKLLSDKSLDRLEVLLGKQFVRIHRSYLVHHDQLKELLSFPGSKYQVLLGNGEILPVGRTRVREIRDRWGG